MPQECVESYETSVVVQFFFEVRNAKNALSMKQHGVSSMTPAPPRRSNNKPSLPNVSQMHQSKEDTPQITQSNSLTTFII